MKAFFIIFSVFTTSACMNAAVNGIPALERAEMCHKKTQPDWRVEGYWRFDQFDLENEYPFPTSHGKPWENKIEFLTKLYEIQNALRSADQVVYYRGLSPSRLEEDVLVGSCEYEDQRARIAWPCGFAEYYVEKFNVMPSQEFYRYVMEFHI